MNLYGRPLDSKVGLKFILIFILVFLTFLQLIIRQFLPWHDVNNRISAIEGLNFVYFNLYGLAELAIFPENLFNLIRILNKPIYKEHLPLSDSQIDAKNEFIKKENNFYKRCRFTSVVGFCAFMTTVFPYFYGLFQINTKDVEKLSNEDIKSPFECWLPFSIKTNFNYILGATPQFISRIICFAVGCNWCNVILGTMKYVSNELKLLKSYVTEMDDRLGPLPYELSLGRFLTKIVDHHIAIIRCVKIINKYSKIMMLGFNQIMGYQLCVELYCLTEMNDIQLKMRFGATILATFVTFLSFSSFGQEVIDEADNLRAAVEQSSWIDKPESYKKSLRIVMINMNRPLQIKPAGLYVLNLRQALMVAKAGYSYLSFIQRIKN